MCAGRGGDRWQNIMIRQCKHAGGGVKKGINEQTGFLTSQCAIRPHSLILNSSVNIKRSYSRGLCGPQESDKHVPITPGCNTSM